MHQKITNCKLVDTLKASLVKERLKTFFDIAYCTVVHHNILLDIENVKLIFQREFKSITPTLISR